MFCVLPVMVTVSHQHVRAQQLKDSLLHPDCQSFYCSWYSLACHKPKYISLQPDQEILTEISDFSLQSSVITIVFLKLGCVNEKQNKKTLVY